MYSLHISTHRFHCNIESLSRSMRFPTIWHLDKCRLRRACAASFKLWNNSKWRSDSSFAIIKHSSDWQRFWWDCAYAQADLRLCLCHIPLCWKSCAMAQIEYTWGMSWKNFKTKQRLQSDDSDQPSHLVWPKFWLCPKWRTKSLYEKRQKENRLVRLGWCQGWS